jgi:hypothetical protein
MKWIGLAAIVLALLGAGISGRLGPCEHQGPSLPAAITARIAVAQIIAGQDHTVASITITPPSRRGAILKITPVQPAGSIWVDRTPDGMVTDIYQRP